MAELSTSTEIDLADISGDELVPLREDAAPGLLHITLTRIRAWLFGTAMAVFDLTGPSDGDTIVYDTVSGEWIPAAPGGGGSLATLSDVDTTGVADGDTLVYDNATSTWIPGAGGGGGGGGGAGVPGLDRAAHKWWRIHIPHAEGVNFAYAIAQCELRATIGGANQATGGTATAKSGTNPGNAFNGNNADFWEDNYGASVATRGSWLMYEAAAPIVVEEVMLGSRTGAGNQLPKFVNIQFSDDGNNFTTAWSAAVEVAANATNYVTSNPSAAFASGGTIEGTAFPSSPANGLRFYRTDRHLEYYWDNTVGEWLSTQLFSFPLGPGDSAWTMPHTATKAAAFRTDNPEGGINDIYVETIRYSTYLAGGTGIWSIATTTFVTGTAIGAAVGTNADAASTPTNHVAAVGAVVASTVTAFQTDLTKTSGAGLYVTGSIRYRLVG